MWESIKKGGKLGLKWGAIIGALIGGLVAASVATVATGTIALVGAPLIIPAAAAFIVGAGMGALAGAIKGGIWGIIIGAGVGLVKTITGRADSQGNISAQPSPGVKLGRNAGIEPSQDLQPERTDNWVKTAQTNTRSQQMAR